MPGCQVLPFVSEAVFRLIIGLLVTMASYSTEASMASMTGKVVIIGGGIHGISLAYYLTKKGVKPLIIEQTSIAAAASGKAGGFLAREWGSGPTVQLHQKSFDMHRELAEELDFESYRAIPTLSADANRRGSNVASWLDKFVSSELMDTETAQVTPTEYCKKLWDAASEAGAEVLIDSVEGIDLAHDVEHDAMFVRGVHTQEHGTVEADVICMCLGPWSGVAVEDWLGLPLPMEGIKSTSIVYEGLDAIRDEPFAVFCAEDRNGCHLELYPRPNGDLYVCGIGRSDYVSGDRLRPGGDCATAEMIEADAGRVSAACASMSNMCSITSRVPDHSQACMRPCPSDGLPVMGQIPGVDGAYISCGHNCWGILWAPISGLSMAELIVEGASRSIDLTMFDPARFMLNAYGQRGRKKGSSDVGEQW